MAFLKSKLMIGIGCILVVLGAAYAYFVQKVAPALLQAALPRAEALAGDYINGSIKIGGIRWSGGLSLTLEDVLLKDEEGKVLAAVGGTQVEVRPWLGLSEPLKAVSRVTLKEPRAYLVLDDKNNWNLAKLMKESDSDETPFYGLLEIENGYLEVATPYGRWGYGVEAEANGGANPDFALAAEIKPRDRNETLALKGQLNMKGEGSLTLDTKVFSLAPYASLAMHLAQAEELAGAVKDVHIHYSNNNGKMRYSGSVDLDSVAAVYAFGGEKYKAVLDGTVKARESIVSFDGLQAFLLDKPIELEGELDLEDATSPEGRLEVRAEELAYKGYTVRDLRIPIAVNKDLLHVAAARAAVGGGLIKAGLSYALKERALACDLDFDKVKLPLPDRPQEEVRLDGEAAFRAAFDEEGSAQIEGAAETLQVGWRSLVLASLTMDGYWDGKKLTLRHLGVRGGEGSLAAVGSIDTKGQLALAGRMAHFPIHPFLDVVDYQGSGYLSADFAVNGSLTAPSFKGKVVLDKAVIMGQKIKEAHGYLALADNIVTVKELEAKMEQGTHSVAGSVDLRGAEPVLDLALETKGVRLEPLVAVAGLTETTHLTGNFDNVMQVTGSLSNLHIEGEAHLYDGSVQGYLLDSVRSRYMLDDGAVYLRSAFISTLGARLRLKGHMDKKQRLDFDVEADDFNLKRLPIMSSEWQMEGLFNAKGHVGGTVSAPYFEGKVNSEAITVNGETLTELSGTLKSNGRDVNKLEAEFKQPHSDSDGEYGLYRAQLSLNIPAHDLRGNVGVLWGKVGGLLRLCNLDYKIDGTLIGDIVINAKGDRRIDIDAHVEDVTIHDLEYYGMRFKGHMQKGVLYLENVKLQEKKEKEHTGIIVAGGLIDTIGKSLDLNLRTVGANPAIITGVMDEPPEITGKMDLFAHVAGSFDDPVGTAYLNIQQAGVAGVKVDNIDAALDVENGAIRLIEAVLAKDIYRVRSRGRIPLDLLYDRGEKKQPDAELDIDIDLDEARLGLLPMFSDLVEWATGDTKGRLHIGGTLESPLLRGGLRIEDGSIKFRQVTSILDHINTDMAFEGDKVVLKELSAALGQGRVTAQGSYAPLAQAEDAYRLHINAKDAKVTGPVFTGTLNSDLVIEPQRYRRRTNDESKQSVTDYRPHVQGKVRLDDVLLNISSVPETGEGDTSLGLDLTLELGPKIHMLNAHLYDIWLNGGLTIKGSTDHPVISGNIKADKGSITYLRTPFKLSRAMLTWVTPGTFLPNVNIESSTRFSRYFIDMKVNGPVDNMTLSMTSNPPLSKDTIVRMLTLQRDSASSDEITGEDVNNLMTVGLQMTVLGDVEMFMKQTLGLDQFRVYTGKARSGVGFESYKDRTQELTEEERENYNILVSKYLTPALLFGYTTSFDAEQSAIFGQIDLSRRFNITYSRRKGLDAADNEDWYGLEYKVSF